MFLPDVFAGLTKEQLAQLRIHRSGESVPLLEAASESLAMQVCARLQVIPFRANQGESWAIPWEKSPVKEIPLRWVDIDRSLQSQTQITGQLSNVTEPDLLEHLKKRQEIRHSGGAEITRSEEFTRQEVMRDPEKGERWANALRDAVQAYSGETGISPDILTRMANDMTKAVERARNPEIGDLVRADPRGDDHLRTPFAGRVIAKLDTSGGDFRYHLRAQTGPDEGMEATFYGRENDFRAVPLEQANGFVRKTQQSASATQAEMETLVRELQRQGQDTACDLTAALRAKNIDCRMDHEQIDGLFYLPIKDSVRVLPESEPLPDDVTAFASIPGVGKLVLPKKAVQEYLASQWATCLDPEKTESSAMENSDSFPNP